MKFKFNSVEEILEFVGHIHTHEPKKINPENFLKDLGVIAHSDFKKISAIRLYRTVFGTDLRSSKEQIEKIIP